MTVTATRPACTPAARLKAGQTLHILHNLFLLADEHPHGFTLATDAPRPTGNTVTLTSTTGRVITLGRDAPTRPTDPTQENTPT